jgi:hypothetical protein
VRVDAVRDAEGPDLVDRGLGPLRDANRALDTAQRRERRQLRPPRQYEPAVAPGGAATADVLLQDRDVAAGIEALDPERRPEPDVPAADDRNVRAGVALDGRRVRRVAGDLLEPERAMLGQ